MRKISKQFIVALGIFSFALVIAFSGNIGAKAAPKAGNVTLGLLASSVALGEDCTCSSGSNGICFRVTVNGNQTCTCNSTSSSTKDCNR